MSVKYNVRGLALQIDNVAEIERQLVELQFRVREKQAELDKARTALYALSARVKNGVGKDVVEIGE